jgi:hypothetical protein
VPASVTEGGQFNAGEIILSENPLPPRIEPSVPDISGDDNTAIIYDLTPYEKDSIDTDEQLVWSISSVNAELFTAEIDAATDVLTITPIHDANGSDVVTFTLTNSHGLTDTQDITITITSVNFPPVFDDITDKTINEGEELVFVVNATDEDGDTLTYSASGLPEGANFNSSTRIFSWTPSFNQGRGEPYSITFSVSDGIVSVSMEAAITVNDVPQPPVAMIVSVTPNPVELGGEVTFAGANISDDSIISVYEWTSSIDGIFYSSSSAIFSTSGLSSGLHTIGLRIKTIDGVWSESVTALLEVVAEPVVITSPIEASEVSGIIDVVAVSNMTTIENMYLYVDSQNVAGDASAPYAFYWNTTGFANGNHTLKIKASYSYYQTYKLFGLIPITVKKTRWVQSAPVSVTVSNPTPDVRIASPQDGAIVSGTVNIEAIADGASFIFYYIDDRWKAVDFAPFSYRWDTTRAADGTHSIYIKAFYLAGLRWITSSVVKVEVEN